MCDLVDSLGPDEGQSYDSSYDVGLDQEIYDFAQVVHKCFPM